MINSTRVNENLSFIISCIEKFQSSECDLVVFPECALTGFTSFIKDTDYSLVSRAIHRIQVNTDSGSTEAFVPTRWSPSKKQYFNSAFCLTPQNALLQSYKEVLTDSEKRFFELKENPTRIIELKGSRVAYLFCIEAAEDTWKYFSESEIPDIILWSSYWRNEKLPVWNNHLEKDSLKVFRNSEIWQTPLVYFTFSKNHDSFGLSNKAVGPPLIINEKNQLQYHSVQGQEETFVVTFQKLEHQRTHVMAVNSDLG